MNKKIIVAIITIIVLALATCITYVVANKETPSQKIVRVSNELTQLVNDTNSSIKSKVEYASGKLLDAKAKEVLYSECIVQNQSAIEFNSTITVADFTSGKELMKPINCDTITINTQPTSESSTGKLTEDTASGS